MQSSIEIVIAQSSDIPGLSKLLGILFAQEKAFTPDTQKQIRGLERIINDPASGRILTARKQGQIVGMINVLFTISTALGERVAILEDMIIAPSARQSGIGSQLLQAAIDFAEQQSCHRLTLLTDDDNTIAQSFYRKHGFSNPGMIPMQRFITPAPGKDSI